MWAHFMPYCAFERANIGQFFESAFISRFFVVFSVLSEGFRAVLGGVLVAKGVCGGVAGGGTGISVGGTGNPVGGIGISVGGTGNPVGGIGFTVGEVGFLVGRIGPLVGRVVSRLSFSKNNIFLLRRFAPASRVRHPLSLT